MYKLLVVDDEAYTRNYMKVHIPKLNEHWEVVCEASDGCEALDMLARHEIDLIITDIRMPEMDGLQLSKQVAELYPSQHIIILSGHDEFAFAKEAIHYGVEFYLLKPIVKEELKEALERITLQIEEEKTKQLAYHTMKNFSDTSKAHVIKNFLKAATSDNSVEIKALYPLIHRFKINLIENEAIIMILALDQDVLLDQSIPVHDYPVFQFILNEVATEIIEGLGKGWVFLDYEEQTVVFLKGESEEALIAASQELFNQINEIMLKDTGISITGTAGNTEHEVLQVYVSYRNAKHMLLNRLTLGGNAFYCYKEQQDIQHRLAVLDKIISTIQSSLLNENDMLYFEAIKQYTELIESTSRSEFYHYGAYLVQHMSRLNTHDQGEKLEKALQQLKMSGRQISLSTTPDEIIHSLSNITKVFSEETSSDPKHINEHDAVRRAKEYIYAHYAEPLSLALIAEKIGVSINYLSSIFHSSLGESYIKFLTRVRMEQAAKLLTVKQPLKIYEISERIGYISVKHFSHVFKKHYHITPGEYQERKGNKTLRSF